MTAGRTRSSAGPMTPDATVRSFPTMHRLAPNLALVRRVLGREPVRVNLRRATTRWTVVVFEPDATARRLYEIASVRGNFTAEDAKLLVVTPTPAEWAEQQVPVVHDADRSIAQAF